MNHLTGALVNGVGALLGSLLGLAWGGRLSAAFRREAMRLMGLVVVVIGVKMAFPLADPVNLLVSVVVGAWLGALLRISERLDVLGQSIERRVGKRGFMQGFISAALIFNVGAMAIVGSLQAGLTRHPTILETKAILDGVTALLLTSTAGWGVVLAAPLTFVYEGVLSILASLLKGFLSGAILTDLSVVGGVMVAAIGVNFLSEKPLINIANLLPALVLTVILGWLKLQGVSFL
ncbi:DUF554 domain-containing protein [Sulfobacillus harzensis]|uniref:DUF554 domain-containing protein n=1 Tax=Sulfobacillus harzensis TaxID=2729629 RepID=A0A7Y0L229_9FIRM|nr:DUF554 domain-containing protein [Sulfobacillus harzensis]NMP20925.1 DUF554 domain-containing protein [Sulfobacillus harzensis]